MDYLGFYWKQQSLNIPSPYRAIVEVADFNFGDVHGTDMEYKSFRQRLVESVHEAVNEARQNRSGVPTDLTGDTSVGYGSMK